MWAGQAARRRDSRGVYGGFRGGEKNLLENPGVHGRIILKRTFRKWSVRAWTGSIWHRIGTGGGHL